MPDIGLQPKQYAVLDEVETGVASWIGLGGGRGAAKSACIDRVALALLASQPGIVCAIVMRTAPQVRKYHIEPMLRAFPELQEYYAVQKGKLKIPTGDGSTYSELDIGYAENYNAVENFFRSGNYKYIFVDQAEQFTKEELREIKKACRWPGGGAKMILSFNMGGIGIGFLRDIFHERKYNEREDPNGYMFLKMNPWDNVFWVLDALRADGLSETDYYSWTDEQRKEYAASKGEYTRLLNSEDDSIRARDWEGSWESLEGAYFGRVFGEHCRIPQSKFRSVVQTWWKRWMSGDWGFGHYSSFYWHARGKLEATDVQRIFNVQRSAALSVVVTYREWLGKDLSEREIAEELLSLSDEQECGKLRYSSIAGLPEKIRSLYFSPDAFEQSIRRSGQNTIADEIGKVLKDGGLPYPIKANNARVSGWRAMYGLMSDTKRFFEGDPGVDCIWLITDECRELLNAIPLAMRDTQKNLDDIVKTDINEAKKEQDALDGCRYGILCREVRDNDEPIESSNARILAALPTPQDRYRRSLTLPKIKPNNFNWKVR